MNNNRGNNRRRGRGNNRPQGGGQQLNRIDSRARGNAPQLLEKYRKLAHDSHLNGDRVQAEYYLQFADHYFRVIADTRLRQEEARARRDDRWQDNGEPFRDEGEDGGDFSMEGDFPSFDQPPVYTRREREDRSDGNGNGRRPPRDEAPREVARDEVAREEAEPAVEGSDDARNIYEPVENPFLRENRGPRVARPRREPREERREPREERRPRREDRAPRAEQPEATAEESTPLSLDPASLPPALGRRPAEDTTDEAPAPKRRVRRKPVAEAEAPVNSAD